MAEKQIRKIKRIRGDQRPNEFSELTIMILTPTSARRAARPSRRSLPRLMADLLFCCAMLLLASGASAEDNSLLQKATGGDPRAELSLADNYQQGINGFPRDLRQSAAWYRRSADHGNARAMDDLGTLYEQGLGVPKDSAKAVALYRAAADRGNAAGMEHLGFLYQQG